MSLKDGRLKINLPTESGQNKEVWVELIEIKVAGEEVMRRHTQGGQINVVPFSRELVEAYKPFGVEPCDATRAFMLWEHVEKVWGEVKKNTVG